MMWLIAGLVVWVVIMFVAIAMARAAAKPYPKRVERFRDDEE